MASRETGRETGKETGKETKPMPEGLNVFKRNTNTVYDRKGLSRPNREQLLQRRSLRETPNKARNNEGKEQPPEMKATLTDIHEDRDVQSTQRVLTQNRKIVDTSWSTKPSFESDTTTPYIQKLQEVNRSVPEGNPLTIEERVQKDFEIRLLERERAKASQSEKQSEQSLQYQSERPTSERSALAEHMNMLREQQTDNKPRSQKQPEINSLRSTENTHKPWDFDQPAFVPEDDSPVARPHSKSEEFQPREPVAPPSDNSNKRGPENSKPSQWDRLLEPIKVEDWAKEF